MISVFTTQIMLFTAKSAEWIWNWIHRELESRIDNWMSPLLFDVANHLLHSIYIIYAHSSFYCSKEMESSGTVNLTDYIRLISIHGSVKTIIIGLIIK